MGMSLSRCLTAMVEFVGDDELVSGGAGVTADVQTSMQ